MTLSVSHRLDGVSVNVGEQERHGAAGTEGVDGDVLGLGPDRVVNMHCQ